MPTYFKHIRHKLKQYHCSTGNCEDNKTQKTNNETFNKSYKMINDYNKLIKTSHSPSSFYTSGIYGTNNCNAYLNGIPRLTKSELASQSVDTLLNHGQEPGKVKTHHNNICAPVENFENNHIENFENNHIGNLNNNSKIIYILLILVSITIILYIYYLINYLFN